MHVPPAATVEPLVQVPPAPIVNVPPATPTFATVGAEASVIAAPLLLVTVTVPEWAVVVPVKREGVGAENATATAELVPLRATGEPVTVQPGAANVRVLLKLPAAAGENTTP